jgi:hypothetical protein
MLYQKLIDQSAQATTIVPVLAKNSTKTTPHPATRRITILQLAFARQAIFSFRFLDAQAYMGNRWRVTMLASALAEMMGTRMDTRIQ